jgi:hypothetical protein
MTFQKIAGVCVVLLGIPLGALALDREFLGSAASIGLMLIFFARERIEDERVLQLKMKAMFYAMIAGIGVIPVANHYLFVVLRGTLISRPPKLAVMEFLSGIVLIALGLFHYWRWQDGREVRPK